MDAVTLRMMENLPPRLKAQGWKFVRHESRPYTTMGTPWYIAVYERRYDHGIDDDRFIQPTEDGYARVSTDQARCPSWVDAYNDAVQMMEEIDGRRKPGDR